MTATRSEPEWPEMAGMTRLGGNFNNQSHTVSQLLYCESYALSSKLEVFDLEAG